MSKLYSFTAVDNLGNEISLADFKDKVVLIVNTASKCGFTPQYSGLQALYDEYSSEGFVVLGFPCNQFGEQEPGNAEEISSFCELNFGVSFPLFAKIDVNGENTHPLYGFLKKSAKGLLGSEKIKWNFTKFLINKDGEVLERFAPQTKPSSLKKKIKNLL